MSRIGLLCVAFVLAANSPALSQDLEIIPGLAQLVADKAIRPVMKNPRSAEFDRNSVVVHPLGKWMGDTPSFRVTGTVRGANSFNAVVPSEWTAYVVHRDGVDTVAMVIFDYKVVHLGKHGADVAKQLEADRIAVEREANAKLELAMAEDRERREEQGRRDTEQRRVDSLRARGRRAGEQAAENMGTAISRMDHKEAERRAKREVLRQKIDKGDADDFVHGYVAGMMDSKARKAAR